ncbi:MAG: hypothetical protein ACREI9_10765 [Nitrospiraceae bacterium]
MAVTKRQSTIPITYCVDDQAHDVTDQSMTANGAAPQPDEACGWSVWVSGLRSGG